MGLLQCLEESIGRGDGELFGVANEDDQVARLMRRHSDAREYDASDLLDADAGGFARASQEPWRIHASTDKQDIGVPRNLRCLFGEGDRAPTRRALFAAPPGFFWANQCLGEKERGRLLSNTGWAFESIGMVHPPRLESARQCLKGGWLPEQGREAHSEPKLHDLGARGYPTLK